MPSIRHHIVRVLSVVIIYTLVGQSVFAAAPDAPEAIAVGAVDFGTKITKAWKRMDMSQYYDIRVPAIFTSLTRSKAKDKKAEAQFDRIEINHQNRTISQGEAIDFVATAFGNGQPVGGVAFTWTISNEASENAKKLPNGHYEGRIPGRYKVRVNANGYYVETGLTVVANSAYPIARILRKPERERTPAEQKQVAQWLASGALTIRNISSRERYSLSNEAALDRIDKKKRELSRGKNDANNASLSEANRTTSVDPIGWDGTNWSTADDPGNWVGRPIGSGMSKGAANGNYNLSIPAVNLDGRGIDINLNLEYNSRLWSVSGTDITYNADSGYPAPGWNLGFGKIFYMGSTGGCMLVTPDGTRRSFNGSNSTYSGGGVFTHDFSGYTTDGSLINYSCNYTSSGGSVYMSGTAYMPNGTIYTFGGAPASNDQLFPTLIKDAHGNYININYKGSVGPEIDYITDTLGRTITFKYDTSTSRLINIEGPGYNSTTRTFLRLHYTSSGVTIDTTFDGSMAPIIATPSPYLLKGIYFPTTANGYWFGDGNSYSPYGMIAKVLQKTGMSSSGTSTSEGSLSGGTMMREQIYNFPTSSNSSLVDSPGYSKLTEDWVGNASPSATPCSGSATTLAVTCYSTTNASGTETITTTLPNLTRQVEESQPSSYGGMNIKTILKEPSPSSTELDRTELTFESGYNSSYRVKYIDHTDDKSQTMRKELTYGSNYNQVSAEKQFKDSGSTLYRERRYTYENSSSYTNRYIFNLVKTAEDYDNSNTRMTRTVYTYDYYGLAAASGIVQHDYHYDPNTTETDPTSICEIWYPDGVGCEYDGQLVFYNGNYVYCGCETYEEISSYDVTTGARGNLTNVTTYTDGAGATGAISYDYTYDIAGNQRTATTNCCQQIGSSYSTATQYLYPDSITKGSSNPMSSDRITQSYSYDGNTKVPTQITDFNGLKTDITYDAISRPTVVTFPYVSGSGSSSVGYKTTTYNDSSLNQNEHVKKADTTTVSNSTAYFNGRGQVDKSRYQAGSSNYNDTQTKYDVMGRVWQVSRPYDSASSPSYWSTTTYDYLGRITQQMSPDTISSVTMTYNPTPTPTPATSNEGHTVTTTDAWGRQRWTRYDLFGRLAEVVEPDPSSSTGAVSGSGAITTTYAYDRLDRLTGITQGSQSRAFAYDSLGRMTLQKLAEQTATINGSGSYVGSGGSGAAWSDAFTYDSRSNLIQRIDARGAITNYDYTVSSSPDPLNRLQNINYALSSGVTGIDVAPTVTFDYMTTGDKTRVREIDTAGVATEENTFDSNGRIDSYTLTLDAQPYKPFEIGYSYDTAFRLTQMDYPEKYQMSSPHNASVPVELSYDQASRLSQLDYGGTAYLSSVTYNTSSQVTSLTTGNGTSTPRVESYTYDAATGLLTGQTVKNTALSSTYLDLTYSYARFSTSAGTSSGSEKTGQMTKIQNNQDNDKDRKYDFDALGRLVNAKGGIAAGASGGGVVANWTQTYSYDRYGNKTGVSVSGVDQNNVNVPSDGLSSTAVTAATNQITAFTYDNAGNITRGQNDSGTWLKFVYDTAGRLTKITDDAGTTDLEIYKYGAGRQKLIREDGNGTMYYVWSGTSIIAEYALRSATPRWIKSYIYAGSRLLMTAARNTSSTEIKETHHPDRLGTKLVTDTAGGTDYQQSTFPFGTKFTAESSGASNQLFTSYDRSAAPVDLDYAVNRTYSSGQGRFTTVDPIGMGAASIGNPQSNNLYAYTQNMPTDFADPEGLLRIWSCNRNWHNGSDGSVVYSAWTCTVVFDDGGGGGGFGGSVVGGINLALKALADPKSACSKLFNPDLMKVSADSLLSKLLTEGNIGFANSTDQLADYIGQSRDFDGITSGENLLNPARRTSTGRAPNAIPNDRTYRATAVMSGDLSTLRTAYVLIHELGHIADRLFGSQASSLEPDGKSNTEFQKKNRETMEECEKSLKSTK